MKLITIAFLIVMLLGNTADDPAIKPDELMSLTAKHWKGTLSYLDYSSSKEVIIPVNLNVIQSETDLDNWYFNFEYPDEPHANETDTITVYEKGRKLNNEIVSENHYTNDSVFTFVTKGSGEDNDKKAELKHIYSLDGNIFIIRKEVKYEDENEFFMRNEYKFEK